jgi:SAM-dependent methyltransferase
MSKQLPSSSSSLLALAAAIGAAVAVGALAGATGWEQIVCRRRRRRRKDENKKTRTAEEHLWQLVQSSFTASLIHAGDALGLFDILYNSSTQQHPISAAKLAERTGWSARWLQEFLVQMTAAGICTLHESTTESSNNEEESESLAFSLKADYAALLRDPDFAPNSLAGMFQGLLPLVARGREAVPHAIQTGVGVSYDWGDDVTTAMDRKNRNWFRDHLIPDVLDRVRIPSTGGRRLVDVLDGAAVQGKTIYIADVGCGCGASTVALAKRFPSARVYAYEASARSLQVLSRRLLRHNITNVTVCDVAHRTVGDGPDGEENGVTKFDFCYAHDVLHDMTDPYSLMVDVRKTLGEGCCWVIVDVKCRDTVRENLRLPGAATMYGFSCLLCLNSATSTRGGLGLGTCGLPASLCRTLTRNAGFAHFRELPVPSIPTNACYVVA